jgi:hypothetical protein
MRARPPTPSGRPVLPAVLPAAVLIGVLTVALLAGTAPGAQAQGQPQLAVEAVHPLGGGSFHFIVGLVDANGDPLTASTVSATPTSPDGTTGGAVILPAAGDGTYQGPVPLADDGTWTVRIASSDPAVAIDYELEVDGDTGTPAATTPTTVATPTTAGSSSPAGSATTVASSTTAAPSTTTPPSSTAPREQENAADPGDDGSSFPTILVVVGAALLVALAGVPLALRTIRRSTDGPGEGEDPDGQVPGDRDGPDGRAD